MLKPFQIYDSAISKAGNTSITVTMCILGNTDTVNRQGDAVRSCFMSWSAAFTPFLLSAGSLEYDGEGKLTAIKAQRTVTNNYNEVSSELT